MLGCSPEKKTPIVYTEQQIEESSKKLNDWFEVEFQKEVADSPMIQTYLGIKTEDYGKWDDISPEKKAKDLERAKIALQYLNDSVDVKTLNKATELSYRILKSDLENEIAEFKYQFYNYPVNQMFGRHSRTPAFLINMHSIENKKEAEDYISRLNGIKPMFDQLVKNLQIREEKGIVPPKFVFPKAIDDSKNILKGLPFEKKEKKSTLLADFDKKVSKLEIFDKEKETLINDAKSALLSSVKPAYENLIAFLTEQEKRATTDDGVWKFPNGKDFFNNALKRTTTTNLTSDQIHGIRLERSSSYS